ncbi:hypothetical protein ATJ97_0764 [Georgenia soli]|uniref:Transmembrane protein n=1 Tax=Georgenia soli TaxID=638953 RepID=A0A2A9EIE1_9MICO|nr:hypothetical protein [Georgenia soli]PFG38291.1 hypothetical protein ATJ97_0764 [Georgenia soli]
MTHADGRVALPRPLKISGGLTVLAAAVVTLLVLGVVGLMGADIVGTRQLLAVPVVLGSLSLPAWPTLALVSARRPRARRAAWWLWPLLVAAAGLGIAGLNWVSSASGASGCTMFCELVLVLGLVTLGAGAVLGGLAVWMFRELGRLRATVLAADP